MKIGFKLFAVLLCILPTCLFAQGLTYDEQVHDFGHIAIDFDVQHTFIFVNRFDIPIKIKGFEVNCDCTTVRSTDTLVQPNDTAFFKLTFNTKDWYGPINKSFSVITDHPMLPELEYFYLSIVGQWFNGIKPWPNSLFFLPSHKTKTINIPNKAFDEILIESISHSESFATSHIVTMKAKKGNTVSIEVSPKDDLPTGTYHSTVLIAIQADDTEITYLSIPIKIVKY